MKVKELMGRKGGRVITCTPEDAVQRAAILLTENRIGALPVVGDGESLAGVISERDLSRGLSERGGQLVAARVSDYMTRDVTVCGPDDSVRQAMGMMSRQHIRHLPVMDGGRLVGIISQRDVLQALLDQTQLEVNVLRDYARARG